MFAVLRHHREGDGRQQAAEPAIADVVRQAHRGVADAGREHFHQHGGDRTVNHGHVQHQDEEDGHNHGLVDLGRIGLGGIAGSLQAFRQLLLEGSNAP